MVTWVTNHENVVWYVTLAVLAVLMVAGVVWASRVWNDVKGEPEGPLTRPADLMDPLTRAYAAGQMSREEFLRIQESVGRADPSPGPDARPVRPKAPRLDDPA